MSGERPAEASATAMMRQLVKLSCFPDYAVASPRRAEVKWETNDIAFTASINKRKDLESGPLQLHVFVHDAPTLAIFQSKNEPYLSFGFSLVTESFYRSRNNHIWPRGKEQTQETIDFMSHALHEGLRLVPDRQALCHLLLQIDDVHFGGPMFVQNYKGIALRLLSVLVISREIGDRTLEQKALHILNSGMIIPTRSSAHPQQDVTLLAQQDVTLLTKQLRPEYEKLLGIKISFE